MSFYARLLEMAASAGAPDELREAAALLRQSQSHDERRRLVQKAITARERAGGDPDLYSSPYPYIRDFFEGVAVYEVGGKLYQCTWAIEGESAKVGEAKRVQVAYTPLAESTDLDEATDLAFDAELLDLTEAEKVAGGFGVKLISPGWGTSGYYSAAVLKRDGPKVFRKDTKMFVDHPTKAEEASRPEGSVTNIGAVLTEDASWRDDAVHGPGLYARAKAVGTMKAALSDLAPHIGVSIRAGGSGRKGSAEGREGPIIEAIHAAKSVDFVTAAGRGGKVLDLLEAWRPGEPIDITTGDIASDQEDDPMTDTALTEAIAALTEQVKEMGGQMAAIKAVATRTSEDLALREAGDLTRTELAKPANRLPAVLQARVLSDVLADLTLAEGKVDRTALTTSIAARLAEARATYAELVGPHGRVVGLGAAPVEAEEKPEDQALRLTEAFAEIGFSPSAAKIAAAGRT